MEIVRFGPKKPIREVGRQRLSKPANNERLSDQGNNNMGGFILVVYMAIGSGRLTMHNEISLRLPGANQQV